MTVTSTYFTPGQAETTSLRCFLQSLLQKQASPQAMTWLSEQDLKIGNSEKHSGFFIAFSAASRFFESKQLVLSAEEKAAAEALREGFKPQYWSQLQVARSLLLLMLPAREAGELSGLLARLAETADVAEQTALYAALPLLPYPEALRSRAAEGIRTNITLVFDAIALHNPYPADYLEEGPWNQMVLKAVFMNRPLYQIWGAERRLNPELAQMLLDFAHERWAAGRAVTPELWRFVGSFITENTLTDVERVSREGSPLEVEAALLACANSSLPAAQELLQKHPQQLQRLKAEDISWRSIGQRYHQQ